MGIRILRTELRRSVALWSALLIAATGVFVLFASNPPYRAWMELVITQRDILQLTWPLALGAGAWQGIRDRRSRVAELFSTTPRPRRWRVVPVASAMAITAVVAYLVMLAGGIGHLRHPEAYFPAGAAGLIAVGALSMVAAVWLGLAIGSLLPSLLTPPFLVVAGFVALALLPVALYDWQLGRPGSSLLFPSLQGPRDGGFTTQTFSARGNLSQALWLVAAAASGLAVFAAARPLMRIAALLPMIIGAAAAVPAMPQPLAAGWIEDRTATAIVCTSDTPLVCTARAHAYALDELTGPGRRARTILAAKLPPAPTRILVLDLNDKPPRNPPADTFVAHTSLVEDDIANYTPDNLVYVILDGAGTQSCSKEPPPEGAVLSPEETRSSAARLVVTAWLLDDDLSTMGGDRRPEVALAQPALTQLLGVPVEEQRARVLAFRDAERACADGDRLGLLTGASADR